MIIVAVVIVAIIGVLAWKGIGNRTGSNPTVPTTENPITTNTTTGVGGKTTGGSIGKMTDEIYIEILAHASVYAQNPETYASRMKLLFVKYGVNEENVKAYTAELEKDPQHLQEISSKYMQRAIELRNTGK